MTYAQKDPLQKLRFALFFPPTPTTPPDMCHTRATMLLLLARNSPTFSEGPRRPRI